MPEAETNARVRHIFARLLDGVSVREIAATEGVTARRVQQIIAAELARRDMNPAKEYKLLQIARLERALDLVGAQIDAGKASAAVAYIRIIEVLDKLTAEPLHLGSPAFRGKDDLRAMEQRLESLAAAREVLAERLAK